MENKKVNILGTDYELCIESEKNNPKLKDCNGLCEQYSKKIIISDFEYTKGDPMTVENFDEYRKRVIRHEIIHAFFGESGLRGNSDFAENEEMVDWIAIQLPKIVAACNVLDAM